MADPTTNADGTKQVSPPTRSAFAQSAAPAKSAPAKSEDTSSTPKHENSIIEGIKGLIAQHSSGTSNKAENSALAAIDANPAPGNTADY